MEYVFSSWPAFNSIFDLFFDVFFFFCTTTKHLATALKKTRDLGGACHWRFCLWISYELFCFSSLVRFSPPLWSMVTTSSLHLWTRRSGPSSLRWLSRLFAHYAFELV
ncbi:hypothetical protein ASPSYDRAFT_288980 [Aspergillus sydowii CBS 593.65]|uniref:Uncharacterized protein n=1 Tax=Aspergillus sydowii CBS 593.65 TaxID=1036612 RepID=A0A1L9TXT7_9EURO|nr:uncharacterized protein ASPSYDRAFT_288980 [Aspergillus sydowii CBS 593.65]OJJ64093.1 hypothetical protein ASPSYDRAFT_288980 [Aspergillus sydowii CBS 593.65]